MSTATTAPQGPSMQSPSIQLDHWASVLAPLTESERASVNAVADWLGSDSAAASKTAQVNALENDESALDVVQKDNNAPGPSSPTRGMTMSDSHVVRLPTSSLVDAPSYLAWFGKQQALIAASAQSGHTRALDEVGRAADEADALLDNLESARVHIAELRAGVRLVEEGTEGLREEAESMVERIDHLSQLAEALALRLTYFAILPNATSLLSSPSLSLVTTSEFFLTLNRLDVALAFVRAHPHYRDAPLYKMRFEHCVVRAGTLIRMYAIGRLKELTTDVGAKLKEWEKSSQSKGKEKAFDADSHAMMTLEEPFVHSLLWERFETEAEGLRSVLAELEKRAAHEEDEAVLDQEVNDVEKRDLNEGQHIDANDGELDQMNVQPFRAPEFAALLQECRSAYFDARKTLLSGIISHCIARIEVIAVHPGAAADVAQEQQDGESSTVGGTETTTTTTTTTTKTEETATSRLVDRAMLFLTTINEAEGQLFAQFFTTSSDERVGNVKALHAYLRLLAAPLDDRLKPRLMSEGSLAGLSAATMRSLQTWREYIVRFLS